MTRATTATVRDATAEDAAGVAPLMADLGYGSPTHEVRRRLAEFAGSPTDHALVATRADQVVGLCTLSLVPLFAEGGRLARITSLVVASTARRCGIGRVLIGEAETIAAATGCRVVQVSSGRRAERGPAHEFYASLGYHDTADHHVLYSRAVGGRAR